MRQLLGARTAFSCGGVTVKREFSHLQTGIRTPGTSYRCTVRLIFQKRRQHSETVAVVFKVYISRLHALRSLVPKLSIWRLSLLSAGGSPLGVPRLCKARFARPSGVTSTADGAAYIAEAASCRLRRVGPTVAFASAPVTCNTTLVEVVRPSGCSSYESPRGGDGLMASPLSGNVWYNSWPTPTSIFGGNDNDWGEHKAVAVALAAESAGGYGEDATSVAGRMLRQCIGFPPPDRLDRANDPRDALTVDDGLRDVPEDTGVGTTIRIACPMYCLNLVADGEVDFVRGGSGGGAVVGSPEFYVDTSAVCMAAVHAGLLTAASKILPASDGHDESSETAVVVVVARLLPGKATAVARAGFVAYNVTSGDAPAGWGRGFALELAHPAEVTAQTIAGKPAGALGEGCGDVVDGQPPQEAVFGRPAGIDAWAWGNLTDEVRSFKGVQKNRRGIRREYGSNGGTRCLYLTLLQVLHARAPTPRQP